MEEVQATENDVDTRNRFKKVAMWMVSERMIKLSVGPSNLYTLLIKHLKCCKVGLLPRQARIFRLQLYSTNSRVRLTYVLIPSSSSNKLLLSSVAKLYLLAWMTYHLTKQLQRWILAFKLIDSSFISISRILALSGMCIWGGRIQNHTTCMLAWVPDLST